MSSWVFTDMQSVHIRMNSSLIPPLKKILDPPMDASPPVSAPAQDHQNCSAVKSHSRTLQHSKTMATTLKTRSYVNEMCILFVI